MRAVPCDGAPQARCLLQAGELLQAALEEAARLDSTPVPLQARWLRTAC